MKNLKFYAAIGLLLLLSGYMVVKLFQLNQTVQAYEKDKTEVKAKILTEAEEIGRIVNQKGIETAIFDVTNNIIPPHKHKEIANSNSKSIGIIDTTAKALDIAVNQLNSVTVVNANLKAENLKLKKELDDNKKPFYTYNGNGLNLKFTPPVTDLDSASADFNASFSLTATQFWKKKFLRSERDFLSITSNNKLFTIDDVEYVGFDRKESDFGLSLNAISRYNFATGEARVGPNLELNYKRFTIGGSYVYEPAAKQWEVVVEPKFRLWGF